MATDTPVSDIIKSLQAQVEELKMIAAGKLQTLWADAPHTYGKQRLVFRISKWKHVETRRCSTRRRSWVHYLTTARAPGTENQAW